MKAIIPSQPQQAKQQTHPFNRAAKQQCGTSGHGNMRRQWQPVTFRMDSMDLKNWMAT